MRLSEASDLFGIESCALRGLLVTTATFGFNGKTLRGKVVIDTGCEGSISIDKSIALELGMPLTLGPGGFGVGGGVTTWRGKLSSLSVDVPGCALKDLTVDVLNIPAPLKKAYGAVALLGLDFINAAKMTYRFTGENTAKVSCPGGTEVDVPIMLSHLQPQNEEKAPPSGFNDRQIPVVIAVVSLVLIAGILLLE